MKDDKTQEVDGSIETAEQQEQQVVRLGRFSVSDDPSVKSGLLCRILQKIPMKDFGAEVRASLDVVQFLNQAVLFLDIHEASLETIIDRILQKVSDFTVYLSLAILFVLLAYDSCACIRILSLELYW